MNPSANSIHGMCTCTGMAGTSLLLSMVSTPNCMDMRRSSEAFPLTGLQEAFDLVHGKITLLHGFSVTGRVRSLQSVMKTYVLTQR